MNDKSSKINNANVNKMEKETESKTCDNDCMIELNDSCFAQSLIPHICLFGINDEYIQKYIPSKSMHSWIHISKNDKDIQDGSHLLIDNNTKLLRSGGLVNTESTYTNAVSLCDLTINNKNNNNIEWHSLPKMSFKRHGHKCLYYGHQSNKPHILMLGGFDSKGNSVKKTELASIDHIKTHISSIISHSSKDTSNSENNGKNGTKNGLKMSNKNESKFWSQNVLKEMPYGCTDFGVCQDIINDRILICGGLDNQFRSMNQCIMYDSHKNEWIHLPKLNVKRNKCQSQFIMNNSGNNNVIMTFGGWEGIARNTIEFLDLRDNNNKWVMDTKKNNQKNAKKRQKMEKLLKANIVNTEPIGYGMFDFPHSNCASVVKSFRSQTNTQKNKKNNRNKCIDLTASSEDSDNDQIMIENEKRIGSLNMDIDSDSSGLLSAVSGKGSNGNLMNENVVIVCGHREGLFIETNVIEALDMRKRLWHTIAKFKYMQNCNDFQNLFNAQSTRVPNANDHSNIDINGYKKHNRYSSAFRYLTLL